MDKTKWNVIGRKSADWGNYMSDKTETGYRLSHYGTAEIYTHKFDIYGMEWYPDKLVFTLNGKETFTYPRLSDVDSTQWPFDQPFYIMK